MNDPEQEREAAFRALAGERYCKPHRCWHTSESCPYCIEQERLTRSGVWSDKVKTPLLDAKEFYGTRISPVFDK